MVNATYMNSLNACRPSSISFEFPLAYVRVGRAFTSARIQGQRSASVTSAVNTLHRAGHMFPSTGHSWPLITGHVALACHGVLLQTLITDCANEVWGDCVVQLKGEMCPENQWNHLERC